MTCQLPSSWSRDDHGDGGPTIQVACGGNRRTLHFLHYELFIETPTKCSSLGSIRIECVRCKDSHSRRRASAIDRYQPFSRAHAATKRCHIGRLSNVDPTPERTFPGSFSELQAEVHPRRLALVQLSTTGAAKPGCSRSCRHRPDTAARP